MHGELTQLVKVLMQAEAAVNRLGEDGCSMLMMRKICKHHEVCLTIWSEPAYMLDSCAMSSHKRACAGSMG
jgi:hypothetical protein